MNTQNKQPEALQVADALDEEFTQGRISNHNGRKAAIELRRLHEVNQELLEALKFAEAALSDIGDADREPGDDVAWCEARAAQAIPQSRDAIAKATGEQGG